MRIPIPLSPHASRIALQFQHRSRTEPSLSVAFISSVSILSRPLGYQPTSDDIAKPLAHIRGSHRHCHEIIGLEGQGHADPLPMLAIDFRPRSFGSWLYLRFTRSLRDVEEPLAERCLEFSYETVRRCVAKFGPAFARSLRRMSPAPNSCFCSYHTAAAYRPGGRWSLPSTSGTLESKSQTPRRRFGLLLRARTSTG
jgi:hypothetical protein